MDQPTHRWHARPKRAVSPVRYQFAIRQIEMVEELMATQTFDDLESAAVEAFAERVLGDYAGANAFFIRVHRFHRGDDGDTGQNSRSRWQTA